MSASTTSFTTNQYRNGIVVEDVILESQGGNVFKLNSHEKGCILQKAELVINGTAVPAGLLNQKEYDKHTGAI